MLGLLSIDSEYKNACNLGVLVRKKERKRKGFVAELCVPVAQLIEHITGKLEICGSNPSLESNFSLNINHLFVL